MKKKLDSEQINNNDDKLNKTSDNSNSQNKDAEKVEVKGRVIGENKIFLEKPTNDPDGKTYDAIVEENRKEILKSYKKSKSMNTYAMIVVIVLLVTALICIVQKTNWGTIVGYVCGGVAIAVLIFFWIFSKKKFPNSSKEYIAKTTKLLNETAFADGQFTDCYYNPDEKFVLSEISCDRVYNNVSDIGSRNIVKGMFNKKSFTCGELALYIDSGKKGQKKVCFLGKYISMNNDLHFEGRYILVNKKEGDKALDLPNDVEDLDKIEEYDNFILYGPKDGKKSTLPPKFINEFKKIQLDSLLMNVCLVLWAGHTSVYLSYDDPVISIPFDKEYNKDPHERYKSDLLKVMNLCKSVNK